MNEKQLHTLRTCYSANPRPDALMKEQLVEMTGLSSRVIRVWFQNKRCKDKKRTILMKQIQQHQHDTVRTTMMMTTTMTTITTTGIIILILPLSDNFFDNFLYKPIINRAFLTLKSRGAIRWLAGVSACEPIANSPSLDYRVKRCYG